MLECDMNTRDALIAALRALCDREGGYTAVARAAHLNDQSVYQILHGVRLKSGEPKGVGRAMQSKLDAAFPGWTNAQRLTEGSNPFAVGEAQFLSHHFVSDDLPMIAWEALVKTPVPEVFRTILVDDALAPEFPKGTEILWTTKRRAMPGRLILVVDRYDQVHARECRQGRDPGRWIAAPINPAYLSFDSDELRLVAVFKARLEPDDVT